MGTKKKSRNTWGKKWPPRAASSSGAEDRVVPFEGAINMTVSGMDVLALIPRGVNRLSVPS